MSVTTTSAGFVRLTFADRHIDLTPSEADSLLADTAAHLRIRQATQSLRGTLRRPTGSASAMQAAEALHPTNR